MDRRVQLLALTASLATAGCGGGSDDAKSAYVEQATAVCERAQADLDAQQRPTSATDLAPFVTELVAVAERSSTELRALAPPEDDRAEIETKVLDPLDAQIEEGRAFAEQVEAAGKDTAALTRLLGQRPGAGDIDVEFLRSYGLETCADALNITG